MKYLIDTDVMSELRRRRANPGVAEWYASVDRDDRYMSVLVVGEMRKGIQQERGRDPVKAEVLERWLELLERDFHEHIVPVDRDASDLWGCMSATRPRPPIDTLQAATAQTRGMTFVTRNVSDVADLGVPILNPFT